MIATAPAEVKAILILKSGQCLYRLVDGSLVSGSDFTLTKEPNHSEVVETWMRVIGPAGEMTGKVAPDPECACPDKANHLATCPEFGWDEELNIEDAAMPQKGSAEGDPPGTEESMG